jgi:hypothetical protein
MKPRPPSRHPNPVIRALRNNRGRYVKITLATGEAFAAFHFWTQNGYAVLRRVGAVRALPVPYREIATVEAIPGEMDRELGRVVDRAIREIRRDEWRTAAGASA